MTVQAGEKAPEGRFTVMNADGPGSLSTEELFGGKKVVLFAVPGAFTPTCSQEHLPGFVEKAAEIKARGVDTIACMAVNDAFVMDAWGSHAHVGDAILMLADGNAEYTQALGLALDASGFGMGTRCQRFAMVVEDGTISQLHIEAPMAFKVSSAENILEHL